jgi:hypothetical protein
MPNNSKLAHFPICALHDNVSLLVYFFDTFVPARQRELLSSGWTKCTMATLQDTSDGNINDN